MPARSEAGFVDEALGERKARREANDVVLDRVGADHGWRVVRRRPGPHGEDRRPRRAIEVGALEGAELHGRETDDLERLTGEKDPRLRGIRREPQLFRRAVAAR